MRENQSVEQEVPTVLQASRSSTTAASYDSTILIVDDTPAGREVLQALLHGEGYRLALAENGPDALAQAAALVPDLILLDVMMPEMDGFEVCQRLRADPLLAEVPIIMVTALDDHQSRLQGIEAGVDDFVSKPFDRAELRARIRTILRLNRYRRLLNERKRFEWVVEQADDGYLIVDSSNRMTFANRQARRYLGLPDEGSLPADQTFCALVMQHYRCEPQHLWEQWPRMPDPPQLLYLVLPESRTTHTMWLHVDLLPLPPGAADERLIRLRDVTAQIVLRRDMRTFHSMVYHKLRTPMVSLIGGLETLLMLSKENAGMDAELVDISLQGAMRLHRTIQGILQYMSAPDLAYTDPGFSLTYLQATTTCISTELGIESVLVTGQEELRHIKVGLSRQAMELIIWELLQNTQKFHPQHQPAVTIAVSRLDEQRVSLCITDDGLTLTPEQLARAWIPYYQGEKEFTGEVPGMGLGLATIAALVWEVGGTCRIANRASGTGIAVELQLPVCQPAPVH